MAVGRRVHRLAHLLARGEQHQRAVVHQANVQHQRVDHLGGEAGRRFGVGAGFGGNQRALGGVVEGAGHFQRVARRHRCARPASRRKKVKAAHSW